MNTFHPALACRFERVTDTRYVELEERLPRESFTRKLESMCRRLDAAPQVQFEYKPLNLDPTKILKGTARATQLWVAGWYARGALACGDLDLVYGVELTGPDQLPPSPGDARRALFGSPPYVRFYSGTPEKNTSGLSFGDSVPIWTGPGCNWQAAVASIKLDPAAGTAPRPTSVLPFPMLGGGRIRHLIDCRTRGVVAWEFIPFGGEHLAAFDEATFPKDWSGLRVWLERGGQAARRLAPALIRLMHATYARAPGKLHSVNDRVVKFGNTVLRFGPDLAVDAADLSAHVALAQCTRIPYVSARGPNGAWVIRRGPAHPLTKFLEAVTLWHVPSPDGIALVRSEPENGMEVLTLQLFATQKDALKYADSRRVRTAPARIGGANLVEAFGACDRVQVTAGAPRAGYAFHELYLRGASGDVPSGWEFLDTLVALQPAKLRPALMQLLDEVRELNAQKGIDRYGSHEDEDEDEDEEDFDVAPLAGLRHTPLA